MSTQASDTSVSNSIVVNAPIERAFSVFTDGFGTFKPPDHNLLSVDIVTADGQLRTASATEHPDLFWAVRGAGSNFGVVTSFEFQLHPVGPMVMLTLTT